MLMAVVVYLYTVIAFNFFRKFYTKEEDDGREENCKDMLTVGGDALDGSGLVRSVAVLQIPSVFGHSSGRWYWRRTGIAQW